MIRLTDILNEGTNQLLGSSVSTNKSNKFGLGYVNGFRTEAVDTKSDFLKAISGNKPAEVYRVHAKLKDGKIGITPWFTKAVIDDVKDDIKKAGHKIIKVEKSTKEADLK